MKNTTPPCPEWRELLSAYHDRQLTVPDSRKVAEHLSGCAACRATREQWEMDRARFTAAYAASTGGATLRVTILEELRMDSQTKPQRSAFHWQFPRRWGLAGLAAVGMHIVLYVMLSASTMPSSVAHRPAVIRMVHLSMAPKPALRMAQAPTASLGYRGLAESPRPTAHNVPAQHPPMQKLPTPAPTSSPDYRGTVESICPTPCCTPANPGVMPGAPMPIMTATTSGPNIVSSHRPIQAVINNINRTQGYAGDPHPVIQGVNGASSSRSANADKVSPGQLADDSVDTIPTPSHAYIGAPSMRNPVAGRGPLIDDSTDAAPTPLYTNISPSEAKLLSPAAPLQSKQAREQHLKATLKMTVTISKIGTVCNIVEDNLDSLSGFAQVVRQDVLETAEIAVRHSIFKSKTIHGDHVDGGTVKVSVVFDGDGYAKVHRAW